MASTPGSSMNDPPTALVGFGGEGTAAAGRLNLKDPPIALVRFGRENVQPQSAKSRLRRKIVDSPWSIPGSRLDRKHYALFSRLLRFGVLHRESQFVDSRLHSDFELSTYVEPEPILSYYKRSGGLPRSLINLLAGKADGHLHHQL